MFDVTFRRCRFSAGKVVSIAREKFQNGVRVGQTGCVIAEGLL